jgi:predicted homoserine dehydrogenase-like protein
MSAWARLRYRQMTSGAAAIAVVGAGWVARGLVWRLAATAGLRPALVVSRRPETGVAALVAAGYDRIGIVVSDEPDDLSEAIRTDRPAVTTSALAAVAADGIDVVVEATGAIDYGSTVILDALAAGRHVVSINAEAEATLGYLMHTTARENGVVYTFSDGDQPGVLLRQLDFVEGIGFDRVAAVNCKRHLDVHQTPAAGLEFQRRDGTSPAITTSAGDGTKMHVENAVVANVRGMPPDCRGMHGVRTTMKHALDDVLASISRPGVVEYTLGGDFGAGVFVIGHAPEPERVQQAMRFFKMGPGPEYLFFRPYHLVQLEMPVTIADVVLDQQGLGIQTAPPVAEVVAVAKRDLQPGEPLDGIGGYTTYGVIDTAAGAAGLLPIGFTEHATVVRRVLQDQSVTLDDVELDHDAPVVRLRARQDALSAETATGCSR